jgi:Ca2+/H+ antiporter
MVQRRAPHQALGYRNPRQFARYNPNSWLDTKGTLQFAAPVLVLTSIVFGKPMNLVFNTFELVAIILSVLIVIQVVGDGESNWFEGLQLILAYAVIAAAFFLHS